jgi:hypothetical protein
MDKNDEVVAAAAAANASTSTSNDTNVAMENEKKSPSFIQQFKTRIAKIEEKFQTRSHDKNNKMQQDTATAMMNMEEGGSSNSMGKNKQNDDEEISPDVPSNEKENSKKGLKFGIRVFPPNVNEKLFGKSKSKSPSPPPAQSPKQDENDDKMTNDEVKINIDQPDGHKMTTEVTIECENFNRQNSITSSVKRDSNGIPQELPTFMLNAATAAREGRKMSGDSETRKSKGKAPRPPMVSVDLDASTETMDTTIADITSESINHTANNTNNVNMEIEDELDRITEKYLSQSKDKLNFTDNFASDSMLMNNTSGSVTLFEKIEQMAIDAADSDEMMMKPSNSSTPKSDRKEFVGTLDTSSDLDLSNYENHAELNSSDIAVNQSGSNNNNNGNSQEDETRRAASLGDLSLRKKSLTEKDGSNSNTLERAQSLDITDNNNLMPKHSLALALSKPTSDLTTINGEGESTTTTPTSAATMMICNGINSDETDGSEVKIKFPLGTLEREPKSDVLKKILGAASLNDNNNATANTLYNETFTTAAPSTIEVDAENASEENVPMTNNSNAMKSVVTIENSSCSNNNNKNSMMMKNGNTTMEVLSIDTKEQQPVSLTLVNNTIDVSSSVDPHQMSPIFSSDNFGVNSIKISTVEMKPITTSSSTVIKNGK